jgi:hypothetical protein
MQTVPLRIGPRRDRRSVEFRGSGPRFIDVADKGMGREGVWGGDGAPNVCFWIFDTAYFDQAPPSGIVQLVAHFTEPGNLGFSV